MLITWTGAAGDNFFFTAGNWSPAQVPGSADDVTVSAAVTISVNGDATVNSLSIGTSTVLDVTSGFSILGLATTADPTDTSTINGSIEVSDSRFSPLPAPSPVPGP